LTIARIVLADGRWHLRTPVITAKHIRASWRREWPKLEDAKRGAESFALMAMPLDPKLAARINKENSTPHPMGPPLNRRLSRENAISSDWKPVNGADMPDIPDFLRRAS
jgi:hypothetical protein